MLSYWTHAITQQAVHLTCFDLHNVHVADLDLFHGLDHIKGERSGAGDGARDSAAYKVGAKLVRAQAAPQPLKQRPVERREGDITEQCRSVAAPKAPCKYKRVPYA